MVFPARAGVILRVRSVKLLWHSVPRTGGGDPQREESIEGQLRCSPHGRGCSSDCGQQAPRYYVFPVRAGVILKA